MVSLGVWQLRVIQIEITVGAFKVSGFIFLFQVRSMDLLKMSEIGVSCSREVEGLHKLSELHLSMLDCCFPKIFE